MHGYLTLGTSVQDLLRQDLVTLLPHHVLPLLPFAVLPLPLILDN
jgi:hypothetical protein